MNCSRSLLRSLVWWIGAGLAFGFGGCKSVFLPKQNVLVDAIASPGVAKPAGQSYRLVPRRSTVAGQSVQVPVIMACVNAALTLGGMYEAPPNVPPDMFIEVSYGTDSSTRVDPALRESFLQLSARSNHARTVETTREAELWDVRVAVLGLVGRLEAAMPLLTQVAATYAGTDTQAETAIGILQNSPAVAAVRENALKALDTKP